MNRSVTPLDASSVLADESEIVIRPRAGFLGFWQLDVELPPTGVEEVN